MAATILRASHRSFELRYFGFLPASPDANLIAIISFLSDSAWLLQQGDSFCADFVIQDSH